jgi:hypothetical protein
MKCEVEMCSVSMIYVHIKFYKDWFRHSELYSEDIRTHRHTYSIVIS